MAEEDAEKERASQLRRSGLILDDGAAVNAMEHGDTPRYIPVKFKNGVPTGDALATLEGFGRLAGHIDDALKAMAGELKRGSIAADPYYRSQQENACLNCDYFDVCHFSDGECGENLNYEPKLKPDEAWQRLKGGNGNG